MLALERNRFLTASVNGVFIMFLLGLPLHVMCSNQLNHLVTKTFKYVLSLDNLSYD